MMEQILYYYAYLTVNTDDFRVNADALTYKIRDTTVHSLEAN